MKNSQKITLGILLALALYVLSFAPVRVYYFQRNIVPPPAVMVFYMPLGWCRVVCAPFDSLMAHYIRLWDPDIFNTDPLP